MDEKYVTRFWSRVERDSLLGCWLWTGRLTDDGYGAAYTGYRVIGAHRFSWQLANGPIPDGAVIRHDCDNPPCVNPAHLRMGTHADNIADKVARGRQARGERNGRAKLTIEKVREIRRRGTAGESATVLAREFGVDRRSIVYALQRVNWRDVA